MRGTGNRIGARGIPIGRQYDYLCHARAHTSVLFLSRALSLSLSFHLSFFLSLSLSLSFSLSLLSFSLSVCLSCFSSLINIILHDTHADTARNDHSQPDGKHAPCQHWCVCVVCLRVSEQESECVRARALSFVRVCARLCARVSHVLCSDNTLSLRVCVCTCVCIIADPQLQKLNAQTSHVSVAISACACTPLRRARIRRYARARGLQFLQFLHFLHSRRGLARIQLWCPDGKREFAYPRTNTGFICV